MNTKIFDTISKEQTYWTKKHLKAMDMQAKRDYKNMKKYWGKNPDKFSCLMLKKSYKNLMLLDQCTRFLQGTLIQKIGEGFSLCPSDKVLIKVIKHLDYLQKKN